MKEFKVGDKVYFPLKTTKVCTLTERGSIGYPLSIFLNYNLESCTFIGEFYENLGIPCIFHATQENKELLEKLHGVEFEAAPPKTRTVTFEMPITFVPELNKDYWFINNFYDNGVSYETNTGSPVDRMCIDRGVWRTKEEALMVANAIFNIEKDS